MSQPTGRLVRVRVASPDRPPAWLPVYLLLVLALTLFPYWPHCAQGGLDTGRPDVADLVQNVLLFLPLGVGLRRVPVPAVLAMGALLSGGVELAQTWVFRSASLWDVAANVAGAGAGRWLAPRLPEALGVPRAPAASAALLLGGLLLAAAAADGERRRSADFSNWTAMPLLVGNEATRDRPWRGTLAEIAVYDRVDGAALPSGDQPPPAWRKGGPVLWLHFQRPVIGRIDGPAGPRPVPAAPPPSVGPRLTADGLQVRGELWSLPSDVARHLRRRLVESGQLAVYARMRSGDLEQDGPARIVSLSVDPGRRSFTLAQSKEEVEFRVRTPATGPNGGRPETRTHDGSLTRSEHRIWASFDGVWGRIEVDGECRGERLIAAASGVGVLAEPLGGVVAGSVALAAWAGSLLGGRSRRRLLGPAAGLLLGAASLAALRAVGAWSHLPALDVLFLLLGALAAIFAIRVGDR